MKYEPLNEADLDELDEYLLSLAGRKMLDHTTVTWYISTMAKTHRRPPDRRGSPRAGARRRPAGAPPPPTVIVERVQTGVRLEKRILKVLKGLAELRDLTLGDLIEGIVLHAFEGMCPFREETLARIADLKRIYGLDLDASMSHRLREPPDLEEA